MTGRELRQYVGHTGTVYAVAFSPDGQSVLTGSDDRTARLWPLWPAAEPRRVNTVSSTGEALTSGTTLALSADSRSILAYANDAERGDALIVWNSQTGERRYLELDLTTSLFTISAYAFSPDERYLLGGGDDGNIWLWEAQTGEALLHLAGHEGPVRAVAFAPDGQTFITGGEDQTAKVWSAATGEELHTLAGHIGAIRAVSIAPDGRLAATSSDDQTAQLWDVQTGQALHTLTGHSQPIRAVAFSPDGHHVLTGSDDQTARLWATQTGDFERAFLGHSAQVGQVAFSPDGRLVLTGSADLSARLWDAQTGALVRQLAGHSSPVAYAGFLEDGRFVVTGDDQSAITWRAALDDLVAFTCAQLTRDLTPAERTAYRITDQANTCVPKT